MDCELLPIKWKGFCWSYCQWVRKTTFNVSQAESCHCCDLIGSVSSRNRKKSQPVKALSSLHRVAEHIISPPSFTLLHTHTRTRTHTHTHTHTHSRTITSYIYLKYQLFLLDRNEIKRRSIGVFYLSLLLIRFSPEKKAPRNLTVSTDLNYFINCA